MALPDVLALAALFAAWPAWAWATVSLALRLMRAPRCIPLEAT